MGKSEQEEWVEVLVGERRLREENRFQVAKGEKEKGRQIYSKGKGGGEVEGSSFSALTFFCFRSLPGLVYMRF